jgi:hypothetical protein
MSLVERFTLWNAARTTEKRLNSLRRAIVRGAKVSRITDLARLAYNDPGVEMQRLRCIPPMLSVVLVQDADFYAWVHGDNNHTRRWLICLSAIRASMPEHTHTL